MGYNALTNQYVNMIEAGIIDPKKVARCALENACSIAALLLTTECLIVETVVKKSEEDIANAGLNF